MRRPLNYLVRFYEYEVFHLLSSANVFVRGCVNPASWLFLDTGNSFMQPLGDKVKVSSLHRIRSPLFNM